MKKDDQNKIFVFTESDNGDLKESLKENGITKIILVNFKNFYENWLEGKIFGEFIALKINKNKLPIIFFGGDPEDCLGLLKEIGWYGREDIAWVKDPYEIADLKKAIAFTTVKKQQ